MLRLALIDCPDSTTCYPRIAARLRGGRFTAVVDGDVQRAASTALALGAAICCDRFDALLADHAAAFDAVVLHVDNGSRVALSHQAAAAGKHLLVNGSLTSSVTEATALLAACADVRLMLGQTVRFLPSVRMVKDCLDAGKLGEPGLLRIHRWESLALPQPELLLNQLTHEIDLACWFFGQRPTILYATGVPTNELNYAQLHLGFTGGGMALLDHARTLPPGGAYFSLSLIGSFGAAYADDHHNTQLLFGPGSPSALLTGQGDGYVLAVLQEFIDAVAENREPCVSGADGLRAAQVAEAAATSIATGHAIRWTGEQYEMVKP